MASTSGSSEMSLRMFDGSNFNFWKEQMQDYLIVKGKIDPIETEIPQEGYKPNECKKLERIVCDYLGAVVGVCVLHSAIVFDRLPTMEVTLRNLWEESRCDKDIFDPVPLQSADKRIWFGPDTPKWVRKFKLPNLGSRDENRELIETSDAHE